jgi:hypothetical protein
MSTVTPVDLRAVPCHGLLVPVVIAAVGLHLEPTV